MRKLLTILLALLLATSAFAQLDKAGKQFLDSLGIKFDPNDPDAEMKVEKALRNKIRGQFDSAMKVAENTVIDPENTEGLLAGIAAKFGLGEDTISTCFEFMQEIPFLELNLDHPHPAFFKKDGIELPSHLKVLIINGNSSGYPLNMNELFTRLSDRNINELYATNDKGGISEIPDNIGSLTDLKVLALYGNNIAKLPESIGNLVDLEELYLDVNPISVLPESIGKLKKLKKLGILKTQIEASEQLRVQKLLPKCQILQK